MKDFNSMGLRELFVYTEGKTWITGRDPSSLNSRGTDDEVLCIRITEKDRKEIIEALRFFKERNE